jgi:predicted cobalt transporter CbtA
MVRSLLIRGMLAGLIAGLLAFGFARTFGEPSLERAIAFEAQSDAAKPHDHRHGDTPPAELVSRSVQSGLGLFTGVVVHATALGGLFALVFAVANGRVAQARPREMAALLGAAGFVAVFLVPALKYPGSPPAIGEPDTIGLRSALFFALLIVSIVATIGAAALRRRLSERMDRWNAGVISAAAWLAAIGLAYWILPDIDEVPAHFPAGVLWQFRRAAFGVQAVLWTSLAVVFGMLTERMATATRRN